MHIYGGKLYGTSTTGHTLLLVLMFPNGLNQSLAKPSLTLPNPIINTLIIMPSHVGSSLF